MSPPTAGFLLWVFGAVVVGLMIASRLRSSAFELTFWLTIAFGWLAVGLLLIFLAIT